MKSIASILLGLMTAALACCEYEVPLSPTQDRKLDAEALGLWERVKDPDNPDASSDASSDGKKEQLLVLKNTETEYVIHYPTGEDGLYFRGYPLELGGVSCVQLQLIGTPKGDLKEKDRRFTAVHYTIEGEKLVLRILNSKVVSPKLKTSAELEKEFISKKDHKELWKDPATFKKLSSPK